MRFFKNTKGAISIFLVIILVPMMTMSALFVDASRVRLGRAIADSAGNLTLNTGLTNYDTLLKDMYGLFATAQNNEELLNSLEDYYRTCMTSAGLTGEETTTFLEQIMGQLGLLADGNDSDLMNMQLIDFNAKEVDNANLANATIIKSQIVNFMKYRSPINTGLSFISALKSFSTLSKQTELVDKRKEYYEAENDVMKNLQSAWNHINNYNKSPFILNPDSYFGNVKTNLNTNFQNSYKNPINYNTIRDLYDTQNNIFYSYQVWKNDNVKFKNAKGEETTVNGVWQIKYRNSGDSYDTQLTDFIGYYPKSKGAYDSSNLPTATDLENLIKSFYSQYNSMESNRAEIKTFESGFYELQYLVQNNRGNKLSRYSSSMANVYSTHQKIVNAVIWIAGYDDKVINDADGNRITFDSIKNTAFEVTGQGTKKIADFYTDINTKFEDAMTKFKPNADKFSGISSGVMAGGKTSTSTVGNLAAEIADGKNDAGGNHVDGVNDYVKALEKASEHLRDAIPFIQAAKTSVESGSLNDAKVAWKKSADDSELKNTSMAKQDLAELDQLGSYLNSTEIQKLIDRLTNVSNKLDTTVAQIKNYKYQDKFIGDIKNYDNVFSALKNKIGDSTLHNVPLKEVGSGGLNEKANELFNWQSGNIDVDWINQSATKIKLHGSGTDKLNFYSYLFTHFNQGNQGNDTTAPDTTKKTEDTTNGKGLYDNIKDNSKNGAKTEADKANGGNGLAIGGNITGTDLPSKNAESNAPTPSGKVDTGDKASKNTSASLSTMFSNLSSALIDAGSDLLNKLYVADYAMSMFSYDTIVNEFNKKNPTASADNNIKTLKNNLISAENNFAYGREIEYVIFGDTNDKNVASAYGSIYAIRLGFNLIYAFMDSSIRDSAFAIATPISAATLGVIPVPLIQAVIIIGVSVCESALDLNDIRNGEAVPIFKNSETWRLSFNGLINVAKDAAKTVLSEAAEYVIDEGTRKLSELLDKTDEELGNLSDDAILTLQGAVGESYDTLITRHANTAIQKLTTLANNSIQEYALNPSLNKIQYVSDGLDNWLAQEAVGVNTSSDLGYIVKKSAVDIIKSQFISQIISTLESSANNVSTSVANLGNEILDVVASIKESINSQIRAVGSKVDQYRQQMIGKIDDSIKNGANDLKETINGQLDGIFGSGGSSSSSSDNTGIASLLSFRYSDYMRLFLMIGLYTNEEAILLRIADVIQTNMRHVPNGNPDFLLKDSATYLEITATIQVKPTFLPLPLFANVSNNPKDNTGWYTFEYRGIKGY